MAFVKTTRISSRGQVVIPKSLREELQLSSGDELIVARDGERLLLRKLTMGDILERAEQDRAEGRTISHEEMKKEFRE